MFPPPEFFSWTVMTEVSFATMLAGAGGGGECAAGAVLTTITTLRLGGFPLDVRAVTVSPPSATAVAFRVLALPVATEGLPLDQVTAWPGTGFPTGVRTVSTSISESPAASV